MTVESETGSTQQLDGGPHQRRSRHGIFTTILYLTAWVIAILGTLLGLAIPFMGPYPDHAELVLPASIGAIVSAWVSAAFIGTIAEISRKLTPRN